MPKLYTAPLEGVTTHIWRSAHREIFGGADRYYTPFLSPNGNFSFQTKELREVTQGEMDLIPQLLTNREIRTPEDAVERIEMGYRAMALKPIAKTMSVSMRVADVATRRGVPCFCADLTVSPVNVEWNKCVAARLPAFPGLGDMGLVESNGHQNYAKWDEMRKDLAYPDAPWTKVRKGVFELDADYWEKSGGILRPMPRYEALFGLS